MNRSSHSLLRAAMAAVTAVFLAATAARARNATQNVTLTAGWNAVWLEVEPVGTDGLPKAPGTVFNHPSVQTVATPKPLAGLAEFFGADPGTVGTFNQDEWQTWKRSGPVNENNLGTITGNRPYLIQVAPGAPLGIPVTGKVRFFRPAWTPDRYNLVGFGLEGSPSFDSFFVPSGTKHPVDRIFRLNGATGAWQHVAGSDLMASGQAYWVFSAGPSTYMGPVAVDFDHAITGTLNFGGPGDAVPVGTGVDQLHLDLEEIVFTNLATAGGPSTTPAMDLTSLDPGAGVLDLHVARPTPNSLAYDRAGQVDSSAPEFPPATPAALGETVAPEKSAILTLGAQRNWTTGLAGRTNLYRLTTGAGSAFWLPVSAIKNDLQPAAAQLPPGAESVAGLWVGDVSVNAATSIVVDGGPVQPTAGSAPLRVLLHSDSSGALKLLTQVTIMRTKSADPSVSPVPVLVVDQAKIAFFEGVKERNGKRVGLRIEATSYDMPRKLDATSQNALLSDPAYPGLTESGLSAFLVSRATRPPSLKEVYDLTWPMTGALGAGQTVTTASPLVLDPFHRSNPFRHAFHQNLPRGPQITRTMTFAFAADQPVPGSLQGTCRETLTGLYKDTLTVSGTIQLRRISTVATLDSAP